MFEVNLETKRITLHRGDTGTVTYRLRGYTFGPQDRVLFTAKSNNGTEIIREVYALENNMFRVRFPNSLTDYLNPGEYKYDARAVVLPVYDPDDPSKIIDCDFDHGGAVRTPKTPLIIEILDTVGQI